MRISVDQGDPGYVNNGALYAVFVDGVRVEKSFTADEELGEVHHYVSDADGKVIIDHVDGDPVCRSEVLKGVVKLVLLSELHA